MPNISKLESRKKRTSLRQWLDSTRLATKDSNPQLPKLIAGKVLRISPAAIISRSEEILISPKKLRQMNNLLGRVLKGRPQNQALKHCSFFNIELRLNSKVLTPRPETESIVSFTIENIPEDSTLLDIGTGSGAIAIAIAKNRPDLNLICTDISPAALKLMGRNLKLNKITNRIQLLRSNLLKSIPKKDLVSAFFIANLPYVHQTMPQVSSKNLSFEPTTSLYSQQKGLQHIHRLLTQLAAYDLLSRSNWLILEHDKSQFKDISSLCQNIGYTIKPISPYVSLVSKGL
jgi:release factor glutamine methyltransferase